MTIQFASYRLFEASRAAANDAMMALLVGSRVAGTSLARLDPSDLGRHLPELFPSVPDVRRMNRTAEDTIGLLANAERFLVYMGIPFVLSVYQTLAVEAIRLLRRDGKDSHTNDPSLIRLDEIHSYLMSQCALSLPATEVDLFDFMRQLRNRIIHYAGIAGSNLRPAYTALPAPARQLWVTLAGRDLGIADSKATLELRARDLVPALAITKRLSKAINGELSRTLSRSLWAELVVEDYRALEPERYSDRAKRLRRVRGLAGHFYADVGLTSEELEAAIARLEEG